MTRQEALGLMPGRKVFDWQLAEVGTVSSFLALDRGEGHEIRLRVTVRFADSFEEYFDHEIEEDLELEGGGV